MPRTLREISDRRPGLNPPQFTLRMLLVVTALVGILITAAQGMDPVGTVVVVIALLSIVAHVASTVIGGQLRSNGARTTDDNPPENDEEFALHESRWVQPMHAEASDFAPATHLSHCEPLNRKPIVVSVGVGAAMGALAGGTFVFVAPWHATLVNILFGAISAAVLGGLFGFWTSSFLQVVCGAWAQARKDIDP